MQKNMVIFLSQCVVYSYDSRYVITGTFRRDGSSRFGDGNKYGNFPSIALAWNASNEDFFNTLAPVVTTLKVRTSYGVLGAIRRFLTTYMYLRSTLTSTTR